MHRTCKRSCKRSCWVLVVLLLFASSCASAHRGHAHSHHHHSHEEDVGQQHSHRHLSGHQHSHSHLHSHAKEIKLDAQGHQHDAAVGDAHLKDDSTQGPRQWWQPTPNGGVTPALKAAAALALFAEAFIGVLIPLLVKGMRSHAWWMGLLNSFSGGIFLSAGLMHLLPHCQEAQEGIDLAKWHLHPEYPLYLLLVTCGYLLVFAVERVFFDGHAHHGHSHGHDCHHGHDGHHSDSSDDSAVLHAAHAPCLHPGSHRQSTDAVAQIADAGGHRKRKSPKPGQEPAGSSLEGRASTQHLQGVSANSSAASLAQPLLLGAAKQAPKLKVGAGITLLAGMTVHTALECLALGLISGHAAFVALFAAVASHKAISALALSAKFVREGATTKEVWLFVGPFCLVPPISIALGAHVAVAPEAHLVLSCFATGTFLYVGCSEVLTEEFEGDVRCGRKDISVVTARLLKFSAVMAAVVAIALLGCMPHEH